MGFKVLGVRNVKGFGCWFTLALLLVRGVRHNRCFQAHIQVSARLA